MKTAIISGTDYRLVRKVTLDMLAMRKHGGGDAHAATCHFLRTGLAKLRVAYQATAAM